MGHEDSPMNATRLDGDKAAVPAKSLRDEEWHRQVLFAAIPLPVLLDPGLSPGAVRLYGYLRVRRGGNSETWVGQERIQADLGIGSNRTIQGQLRELKGAGYLESKRRGIGDTNLYRLPRIEDAMKVMPDEYKAALVEKLSAYGISEEDIRLLDGAESALADSAQKGHSRKCRNSTTNKRQEEVDTRHNKTPPSPPSGGDEIPEPTNIAEEKPTEWANRKLQEFCTAALNRYGTPLRLSFARSNKALCQRVKSGATRLEVGTVLAEVLYETDDAFVAALRGDIPRAMSDYWFNRLLTRAMERERNGA